MKMIAISIVSHGHGQMIEGALHSIALSAGSCCQHILVLLTLNRPEAELEARLKNISWRFELRIINNIQSIGYGANHNKAFSALDDPVSFKWFVIMNPDIVWPKDTNDFWYGLCSDPQPETIGMICPQQIDLVGMRQDFARSLITPMSLFNRLLLRLFDNFNKQKILSVRQADWVNGACMVWRADVFSMLNGFDDHYFMYCEDTDICLRLQLAGYRMCESPVSVIHDAQRQTGRSWHHLRWHLRSLVRLWSSATYWKYVYSRLVVNVN